MIIDRNKLLIINGIVDKIITKINKEELIYLNL